MAVRDHLKFEQPKFLDKRAKPIFEATGHQLYYYASSEADEAGKHFVSVTLDRNTMWDCNAVNGSSTAYEFIGLPPCAEARMIIKRTLPCPCEACFRLEYAGCLHSDIVGTFVLQEMKYQEQDCPEILVVPLEQYTNNVLKAFIKVRTGRSAKQTTKPTLIKYIVDNFREYIDYADNYGDLHEE